MDLLKTAALPLMCGTWMIAPGFGETALAASAASSADPP